jgi:hypothetical protein
MNDYPEIHAAVFCLKNRPICYSLIMTLLFFLSMLTHAITIGVNVAQNNHVFPESGYTLVLSTFGFIFGLVITVDEYAAILRQRSVDVKTEV